MPAKCACKPVPGLFRFVACLPLSLPGCASQKSREASAPAGPLSRGPLEKPEPEPSKPSDDSAGSSFGVPQVAVGVLSLLLVGVFVVTSGYGPAGPVGQQSQSQQVPFCQPTTCCFLQYVFYSFWIRVYILRILFFNPHSWKPPHCEFARHS